MTTRVGDIVTNKRGTLFYVVRHVGPRGAASCEPLHRTPRRHSTVISQPRLVRTAELERFFSLVSRAHHYRAIGESHMAGAMTVQARDWLGRVNARGEDDKGALAAGLAKLRGLYREAVVS